MLDEAWRKYTPLIILDLSTYINKYEEEIETKSCNQIISRSIMKIQIIGSIDLTIDGSLDCLIYKWEWFEYVRVNFEKINDQLSLSFFYEDWLLFLLNCLLINAVEYNHRCTFSLDTCGWNIGRRFQVKNLDDDSNDKGKRMFIPRSFSNKTFPLLSFGCYWSK